MSSINWNVELKKLEREFDGKPPAPARPSSAELRQQAAARRQVEDKAAALGVWARIILVAALAGSLGFWPYARECGPGLFTFMGAGTMVMIGGLWVAFCTWRNRMALAHTLALVMLLAGLIAVGHQVLPRVGYARIDPRNPPLWQCQAPVTPPGIR